MQTPKFSARYVVTVRIEGEPEAVYLCNTANECAILREAIESKHSIWANVVIMDAEQSIRVY